MNTIHGKIRGKGNVPISIQKEIKKEGEGNCRVSLYLHYLTFEEIDYVEKALDGIVHNVLVMRGEIIEEITCDDATNNATEGKSKEEIEEMLKISMKEAEE